MSAVHWCDPNPKLTSKAVHLLEELYLRHGSDFQHHARKFTGCAESAEDVIHDVFLHLIRRPAPLAALSRAYVFQSVRNRALECLRREKAATRRMPATYGENQVYPPCLAHELERRAMIATLNAAVEALPSRYRQAFVLVAEVGVSYADASAEMGVSVHTVRELVRRARYKLRIQLQTIRDIANA